MAPVAHAVGGVVTDDRALGFPAVHRAAGLVLGAHVASQGQRVALKQVHDYIN